MADDVDHDRLAAVVNQRRREAARRPEQGRRPMVIHLRSGKLVWADGRLKWKQHTSEEMADDFIRQLTLEWRRTGRHQQ
jgi:hypothetical protein